MRTLPAPDLIFIRKMFSYDEATGVLTRVWHPSRNDMNGVIRCAPYKTISVCRARYQMSNIIFYHYHGTWPTEMIDHKDRDPCNMRIANLREATRAQNKHNSACSGASFCDGKWEARCQANGEYKYLGRFDTQDLAEAAFREYVKSIDEVFYAL